MSAMEKATRHPQMARVYEAARVALKSRGPVAQSALAASINVAPQIINNWEKRGPSKSGLLQFQQTLGVNATWVEFQTGPMLIDAQPHAAAPPAHHPARTAADPRVGSLSSLEVDVVLSLRKLPDLQRQRTRIDLMIAAEAIDQRATMALAKAGITAPPVTAERAAQVLPAPPGGPARDTIPGALDPHSADSG